MDAYIDVQAFERTAHDTGLLTDRQPGTLAAAALGHLARHGSRPDGGRVIHRFSTYGLAVESNVALPGVAPDSSVAAADVIVRLAEADRCRFAAVPGERAWYVSPDRDDEDVPWLTVWRGDGFRFVYGEGAEFLRQSGRHRGGWPLARAAHPCRRRQLSAGARAGVRAPPARRRAAARRGGRGPRRGAGCSRAPPAPASPAPSPPLGPWVCVLSDDVVPLRVTPDGIVAAPGFPRVSVWDDTASAILGRSPGNCRRGATPTASAASTARPRLPLSRTVAAEVAIYLLQPRGDQDRDVRRLRPARRCWRWRPIATAAICWIGGCARSSSTCSRRGAAGARQHGAIRRRSRSSAGLVRGAAGVASRR